MAWNYTTGLLTSTGATNASPDSLLAGIDIVQAADATRGYRNGNVAWVNNLDVVISGTSFIKADNDSTIEWKGSSGIRGASNANITGGFIGGASAKFILNVSTSRFLPFNNGATFITERRNPQDPSFSVYQNGTVRVDFPTFGSIGSASTLAKIDVNGLDLYTNKSQINVLTTRFYAGATISTVKDVRAFDRFGNDSLTMLLYGATYTNSYFENLYAGSETGLINTVNLVSPTFYKSTQGAFIGLLRSATFVLTNPTILNNAWGGTVKFNSADAASKFYIRYSYTNTFKSGLTAIEGVNVRFSRTRQSVNGSPTWTEPNATITALSNVSGQYTAVNLLDAYREGTSLTNLERFNWTLKARKYDKKTAGETIFASRVLYQHSVNMSAGYSEEVQMLDVPYLTLTEAQASALTGITFTPSGATGGTVTITGARTIAELWQYYRYWISQQANFDSNDTWTYDGTTLNIGAWTITGIENLSGGAITTTTATANGAFSIEVIGTVNQDTPTNLPATAKATTLIYLTNTPVSVNYATGATFNTVRNDGTAIVTISGGSITDYSDQQINYLNSTATIQLPTGFDVFAIYASNADALAEVNPLFSGDTVNNVIRYKAEQYGGQTIYIRPSDNDIVGEVLIMPQVVPTGIWNYTFTVVSFSESTQLNTLIAQVTQLQTNLPKVNSNVIKASKLIPANETF